MESDWLAQAREDLAAAVGDGVGAYDLSKDDVDRLLELARVAAHESGDRKTAPLTTYLAGLARGRHPEQSLQDLVQAVVRRYEPLGSELGSDPRSDPSSA